jgi:hypothetical protein
MTWGGAPANRSHRRAPPSASNERRDSPGMGHRRPATCAWSATPFGSPHGVRVVVRPGSLAWPAVGDEQAHDQQQDYRTDHDDGRYPGVRQDVDAWPVTARPRHRLPSGCGPQACPTRRKSGTSAHLVSSHPPQGVASCPHPMIPSRRTGHDRLRIRPPARWCRRNRQPASSPHVGPTVVQRSTPLARSGRPTTPFRLKRHPLRTRRPSAPTFLSLGLGAQPRTQLDDLCRDAGGEAVEVRNQLSVR